jgi:hypothetical protein
MFVFKCFFAVRSQPLALHLKTNTNSDSGLQNRTAQRDKRQPEFKVKTSWTPIPLALAFTLRALSGGRKGFQF